jgi:hypothetical protein
VNQARLYQRISKDIDELVRIGVCVENAETGAFSRRVLVGGLAGGTLLSLTSLSLPAAAASVSLNVITGEDIEALNGEWYWGADGSKFTVTVYFSSIPDSVRDLFVVGEEWTLTLGAYQNIDGDTVSGLSTTGTQEDGNQYINFDFDENTTIRPERCAILSGTLSRGSTVIGPFSPIVDFFPEGGGTWPTACAV